MYVFKQIQMIKYTFKLSCYIILTIQMGIKALIKNSVAFIPFSNDSQIFIQQDNALHYL